MDVHQQPGAGIEVPVESTHNPVTEETIGVERVVGVETKATPCAVGRDTLRFDPNVGVPCSKARHWNTAETREEVNTLVKTQFPMSEHYFASGDDFEVVKDDLNYILLSVGLDENLSIRATCLFAPPSKDRPIPEIVCWQLYHHI